MFCPECGKEVNGRFCNACGADAGINNAAPAPAPGGAYNAPPYRPGLGVPRAAGAVSAISPDSSIFHLAASALGALSGISVIYYFIRFMYDIREATSSDLSDMHRYLKMLGGSGGYNMVTTRSVLVFGILVGLGVIALAAICFVKKEKIFSYILAAGLVLNVFFLSFTLSSFNFIHKMTSGFGIGPDGWVGSRFCAVIMILVTLGGIAGVAAPIVLKMLKPKAPTAPRGW